MLLCLLAVGADARPVEGQPERCSASFSTMPALEELSALSAWSCPAEFRAAPDKVQVLRIDVSGLSGKGGLRYAVSRKADFEHLTLVTQDSDGILRSARFGFADGRQAYLDRQFSLPLPVVNERSTRVYALIEGAKETMPLDYLRLVADLPGTSAEDQFALQLFAFVLGILIVPLLIDAGVFLVLRERFSLYHAAMVGATFVHLVTVSGINMALEPLDLPTSRFLGVASFGGIIIAANLFVANFIELPNQGRHTRPVFHGLAAMVALATALHSAQLSSLGRYPADFFYLACTACSPFFFVAVAKAWRRGSRAARFLAIGFAPLVGVGLIRTVSKLIPGMPTYDAGTLFLLGIVLEVVATTFGVADRFLALRRDRDKARSEANALARLARLDPLTGIANRHALSSDFEALVAQGFRSMALLDLDYFKHINDEFGHGTGDEVLVATAEALVGEEGVEAYRLGGEEFLLLLRGADARRKAEGRRRAITMMATHKVPGLDRPVTASMGVIGFEALAQDGPPDFAMLYSRVDELLYRAKEGGRNRMCAADLHLHSSAAESGPNLDAAVA